MHNQTGPNWSFLPCYPDVFDVMFDSVKIEGLPVEAEEDSDEMDSNFSDDEQDEDGLGYDEYLNLPTNHRVPCDQCVRFVAKDPTAATTHRWRRWLCHREDMSCQTVMLFTFDPAFSVSTIFRFEAATVIETKDAFMNVSWVAGTSSL